MVEKCWLDLLGFLIFAGIPFRAEYYAVLTSAYDFEKRQILSEIFIGLICENSGWNYNLFF